MMSKSAAALAALLLAAAPAAAQPPPDDSYRGEHDFTPPPAPPAELGRLHQLIGEREADTFAGIWVFPNQRDIAIAFTRDAEATLRKYTQNPRYRPVNRPGPTVAELQATQQRLFNELQRLGARPVSASDDIREGTVTIEVVGDMTAARAAIESGALVVPPYAKIHEPPPLAYPDPPPPPPGYVSPVKAFPRIGYRHGGAELAILRIGEAVLEDGCLRLKGDRASPVIVWPNEARLDLSHGDVRVFNRMSGATIRPGEKITLGGNAGPLRTEADVIDADPACPGPYYLITNFGPYAPLEVRMWDQQVQAYAHEHKVSLAEARRILEAQAAREQQLRAFGERLKAERPDLFGELTTWGGKATLRLAGDPPPGLIPAELAADIVVERVSRSLAGLEAERHRLLDEIEAAGLEATAHSQVDLGRILLEVPDIAALSQAAVAGRVAIPDSVQIVTSGATPAGYFGEWNMEAAWNVLESAPDFAAIRALVAATALPFYGDAPRKPNANGATDIARYLVMLGFSAKDITALRAQGVDPVSAWVKMNGLSTLEDRAVLAEQVVVGEVLSVDPRGRGLNDGARTTVHFRVAETLKGDARVGDTVVVRLVSGYDLDGRYQQENGEPMLLPGLPKALKPGDRYLLFLSSGQYANLARHAGYKPANPRWHALRHEMARIEDGLVARTYGEPSPGTLAEVRARLRPVQEAFIEAEIYR